MSVEGQGTQNGTPTVVRQSTAVAEAAETTESPAQVSVSSGMRSDIGRTHQQTQRNFADAEAVGVDMVNITIDAEKAGEDAEKRDKLWLKIDEIGDIADRGAQSEWANQDRIRRREAHYGKSFVGKANAWMAGATFRMEGLEHEILKRGEHPARRNSDGTAKSGDPSRMDRALDWVKLRIYNVDDRFDPKSKYNAKSEAFRKSVKVLGKVASSTTLAYVCAALLASGVGAPVAGAAAVGAGAARVGFEAYRVIHGRERKNRVELENHYDEYYKQVQEYARQLFRLHESLRETNKDTRGYDVFRDKKFVEGEGGPVSYTGLIDLMYDESKRKIQIKTYDEEDEEPKEVNLIESEKELRRHERNAETWSGMFAFVGGMGAGWAHGLLAGRKLAAERGAAAAQSFKDAFEKGQQTVKIDLDGDGILHNVAKITDKAWDSVRDKIDNAFAYLKDSAHSTGEFVRSGGKLVSNPDLYSPMGDQTANIAGLEGNWHQIHDITAQGRDAARIAIEKVNEAAQNAANAEGARTAAQVVGQQLAAFYATGAGFLAQALARPAVDLVYQPEKRAQEQMKHENLTDKKEALGNQLELGQLPVSDSGGDDNGGRPESTPGVAGESGRLDGEVWENQALGRGTILFVSSDLRISPDLTIKKNQLVGVVAVDGNGNYDLACSSGRFTILNNQGELKKNFKIINPADLSAEVRREYDALISSERDVAGSPKKQPAESSVKTDDEHPKPPDQEDKKEPKPESLGLKDRNKAVLIKSIGELYQVRDKLSDSSTIQLFNNLHASIHALVNVRELSNIEEGSTHLLDIAKYKESANRFQIKIKKKAGELFFEVYFKDDSGKIGDQADIIVTPGAQGGPKVQYLDGGKYKFATEASETGDKMKQVIKTIFKVEAEPGLQSELKAGDIPKLMDEVDKIIRPMKESDEIDKDRVKRLFVQMPSDDIFEVTYSPSDYYIQENPGDNPRKIVPEVFFGRVSEIFIGKK